MDEIFIFFVNTLYEFLRWMKYALLTLINWIN